MARGLLIAGVMMNHRSVRLFLLASCFGLTVGCNGAANTPQPSLSVLAQADPTTAAAAQSCTQGFLLTQLPHVVDQPFDAVRTSAGVWHFVYGVRYESNGQTYLGLRHASSDDFTRADSIAWSVPNAWQPFALAIGADDIPTLFFLEWQPANSATTPISRARWMNGNWQIDAMPITARTTAPSQPINVTNSAFFATIDKNGHAHLFVNSLVLSDVTGSWVMTNLGQTFGGGSFAGAAVDGSGHEYVRYSPSQPSAGFVASNVSGSWKIIPKTDGFIDQFLATDGQGDVHGIGVAPGENRGPVDNTDLSTGAPVTTNGMITSVNGVGLGEVDPAGNPVLLTIEPSTSAFATYQLWSVVNGTLQAQTLPSDQLTAQSLVVDSLGQGHIVALGANLAAVLDPCQ